MDSDFGGFLIDSSMQPSEAPCTQLSLCLFTTLLIWEGELYLLFCDSVAYWSSKILFQVRVIIKYRIFLKNHSPEILKWKNGDRESSVACCLVENSLKTYVSIKSFQKVSKSYKVPDYELFIKEFYIFKCHVSLFFYWPCSCFLDELQNFHPFPQWSTSTFRSITQDLFSFYMWIVSRKVSL